MSFLYTGVYYVLGSLYPILSTCTNIESGTNNGGRSLKLERTEAQARHYKNPDNNPRGPWFDGNPLNSPNPRKNLMYSLKAPNGWRWDKGTLQSKIDSGEI